MCLWAIVPVKPLNLGKSRLCQVLTDLQRTELNQQLFQNTISVLKQVPKISEILVVSRDSNVLTIARASGLRTVQENGNPELNQALLRASVFAQVYSPEGVIIVPADLPLLQPADVEMVIEKNHVPPVVVIAPDRRKEGTNMLLVSPAQLITYSFGKESFKTHLALAKASGARVEIVENERIALDLDLPEDWALLNTIKTSV